MSVTIKDVAKHSGVGIATVSRVLSGTGSVSMEKKDRVMRAVRELNYIPNDNARNLRKNQGSMVLILAKSAENPFFQELIYSLSKILMLQGVGTEVHDVGPYGDEAAAAAAASGRGNLSGIVMLGGSFSYSNDLFTSIRVPCVLVTIKASPDVDSTLYSSIIVDDELEMENATEQLIQLGHKRIGLIYTKSSEDATPHTLRAQGYRRALEKHGIPFDARLVSPPLNPYWSGYEFGFSAMQGLLAANPDITGLVTTSDTIAVGAAKAVLASGRSIPGDLSIIGFDGAECAEYFHPSLDTVSQPVQQIAEHAAAALNQMLSGNGTSHTILKCNLIRRGSSRSLL